MEKEIEEAVKVGMKVKEYCQCYATSPHQCTKKCNEKALKATAEHVRATMAATYAHLAESKWDCCKEAKAEGRVEALKEFRDSFTDEEKDWIKRRTGKKK